MQPSSSSVGFSRQPSQYPLNLSLVFPARTHCPPTSTIDPHLGIRYSSILPPCFNHHFTLWSTAPSNSLSIPALLNTSSVVTPSIRVTSPNFLNISFQEHSLSFYQLFTYTMHLRHTTHNAVSTITHTNHLLLWTLLIGHHPFYPSLIYVPHPFHIIDLLPIATPSTQNIRLPLIVHHLVSRPHLFHIRLSLAPRNFTITCMHSQFSFLSHLYYYFYYYNQQRSPKWDFF